MKLEAVRGPQDLVASSDSTGNWFVPDWELQVVELATLASPTVKESPMNMMRRPVVNAVGNLGVTNLQARK